MESVTLKRNLKGRPYLQTYLGNLSIVWCFGCMFPATRFRDGYIVPLYRSKLGHRHLFLPQWDHRLSHHGHANT